MLSRAALRFASVFAFLPNERMTWLSIIILPLTVASTRSSAIAD